MSLEIALQRIEEVKKNQNDHLYIGNLNLERIPEEIQELTHLISISLNNNKLTEVEHLDKLINLRYLLLFNNQIKDIQPLENLICPIKTLTLEGNQIEDILPICKLSTLEFLPLARNNISYIPKEIIYLTSLIELEIWDNPLSNEERNKFQWFIPHARVDPYEF